MVYEDTYSTIKCEIMLKQVGNNSNAVITIKWGIIAISYTLGINSNQVGDNSDKHQQQQIIRY